MSFLSGRKSVVSFFQDAPPDSPLIGDTWYSTTNGDYKSWNGTTWAPINKGAMGGKRGYIMGGDYNGAQSANIETIMFPADTGRGWAAGELTVSLSNYGAGCNSSTNGYLMGGRFIPGSNMHVVQSIEFQHDDGYSFTVGSLGNIERDRNSGYNSSLYGYSAGGVDEVSATQKTVRYTVFPQLTGSMVNLAPLVATSFNAGGCNSSSNGYIFNSGNTGAAYTTIENMVFPAGGPFILGTAISGANHLYAGHSSFNSSSYGYHGGGRNAAGIAYDEMRTVTFSSGAVTTTSGKLATARYRSAGVNSSISGYICGGIGSGGAPILDTVEAMDMAFPSSAMGVVTTLSGTKRDSTPCDDTDFVSMFV